MSKLVRASRASELLTKQSASVPSIPGLTGENSSTLMPMPAPFRQPAGSQGRLERSTAPRAKLKMVQGPRAYAPRLAKPGT